jgi:hypothetical protein
MDLKQRIVGWMFLMAVVMPLFPSDNVWGQQPAVPVAEPRIERFDIDPAPRLAPGEALIFRISGSSRGTASVKIGGVKGKVALRERLPGIYEGAYTIKTGDEIGIDSLVIGNLSHGSQELSVVLAQPLVEPSPVAAWQTVPTRRTYQ